MCLYAGMEEGSEAKRLRRAAAALAGSSGALAIAPALSLTHGHHVFAWTLISAQLSLLCASGVLLARSNRAAARSAAKSRAGGD